jgi:uncharacterized membrane protein (Fun14 family)
MTLLENEEKLDYLGNSVLLTNYRVLNEHGDKYKISIFLEKISSIVVHFKQNIFVLIAGIISLIVGLAGANYDLSILIVVGIVLIAVWWFTRKFVITISPDGGKDLDIEVKNTSSDRIEDFITKIQEAKQKKNSTN